MRRALSGTWVKCSDVGLFEQPHDALRVDADDHFALLRAENGTFVPLSGPENEGRVGYLDTSDANGPYTYQVDFQRSSDGGTATTVPTLSDVPRLMLIGIPGPDHPYRYRRLEPSGPNEGKTLGANGPAPGDVAQPTGEITCGPLNAPFIMDPSAIRAAMRGTWALCSTYGVLSQPHAGFYVGPDDRYVLLGKENGRLVPLAGLENKGQIEVVSANQIDFVLDLGFWTVTQPLIGMNPKLFYYDTGFVNIVYAHLP
jgi:hypothetical protein